MIFLDFPSEITSYLCLLTEFLEARGLYIVNDSFRNYLVSEGFDFLCWNISRKSLYLPYVTISKKSIKDYKCRIKAIVKSSYNKNIILVINLLNYEIQEWKRLYLFSSGLGSLAIELDIYLYKVIWKYVRRCHPRRTNTWIYSKYWKQFSGVWKFFVFDLIQNKVLFLKSHIVEFACFYKTSSSLNIFNLYNKRKVHVSLFNKKSLSFSSSFNILYEKQKGLCFICKKPLLPKNSRLIRSIVNNGHENTNFFGNFNLIHNYCRFSY